MLNRPLQLTTVLTLCLMIALSPLAIAGTTYTWTYVFFNDEVPDYRDLDDATDSISLVFYNHLTFNETTSEAKACIGVCNGSSGTIYRVELLWLKYENNFEVVLNMPDYIKIATGSWTVNGTMCFSINKAGDLLVYEIASDKTKTIIIDDYNIGTFTTRSLSATGIANSTESGYMSVELKLLGGGLDISEWMPVIMSLAMLGIVIGFVKKMSK